MTKYYSLEPECPGSLGNDTEIVDLSARPIRFEHFQLVVERWPEDDLLESMLGGYAITENLASALKASDLGGFELGDIDVLEGDQLFLSKEEHPEGLPNLVWLKVTGIAGQNDFGFRDEPPKCPLIVSERAMAVLKDFKINNCIVEEYQNPLVRG
jgi:hypothetical protein